MRVRVDGVDPSRRLIEFARRNAASARVSGRARLEVGDAAGLRWLEGTRDRAISTGTPHILRDPVRVLRESHRVLKPGGDVWIYNQARVSSQIDVQKWKGSFASGEWRLYGLFLIFAKVDPGRGYSRGQAVSMIEAVGFPDPRIRQRKGEIEARMTKRA